MSKITVKTPKGLKLKCWEDLDDGVHYALVDYEGRQFNAIVDIWRDEETNLDILGLQGEGGFNTNETEDIPTLIHVWENVSISLR